MSDVPGDSDERPGQRPTPEGAPTPPPNPPTGSGPADGRQGPASREQAPPIPAGYAPAPPRRPGGFGSGFGKGMGFALGAGVVLTVSTVLSLITLLASSALLAGSIEDGASTTLTTVWGDDDAEGTLRAIEISGPILADASEGSVMSAGTYGYEVAQMIRDLDGDDADGIVILANTPGGSVSGSAAIADAVADYRERTRKKVLVHVSSMSASGGVYSTSTADEIWADEGALVGSIGVISGPFQHYSDVTAIGSTILQPGVEAGKITQEYLAAGRGKAFGDPFNEMGEAERKQWMEMINASYDTFVQRMVEGRGMNAKTIRETMGAGVFGVEKAKEYKLIDGKKGRDEFFRYAAQQAGLDPKDTKVQQVTADAGLLGSLLGAERAYGQALPAAQGQGVTPVLSEAMCSPRAILALRGPSSSICG